MKKILLIGDSIRKGYDKYVKAAFDGVADVRYPSENCMFSLVVFRMLPVWAEELGCGSELDLIHWNAGLWDDLVIDDGRRFVTPEAYRENIERICEIIKDIFPKAKMIFATSTPVIESKFSGRYRRYNKDTELFNHIACETVEKFDGEINDLYSVMKTVPDSYHSDQTHFYTKEGTRLITEAVVSKLEYALNIRGKALDYDKYFGADGKIVGL